MRTSTSYVWTAAVGMTATIFVALRFVGLDADPPAMFQRLGHSLVTDPYYYTWFARNAVLFGNWDPQDYHRYAIFGHTIVSGLSYIVFSLAGVSRVTAHLAALILSLSGMALFAAAFWKRSDSVFRGMLVLLLSSNVFLFYYSRYPLMESGLLLYAGLITFVLFTWGDRTWGQLLAGFLIALTALTGKLQGALLVVPAVAALLVSSDKKKLTAIVAVAAGVVAGCAAYIVIFWGGSLAGLIDYFDEVRATVVADGRSSPVGLFTSLVSYWAQPTIVVFHSIPLGIALIGLLFAALSPVEIFRRERGALVFALTWIAVATLILSIPVWRPARHMVFVLLPVSWLAAKVLSQWVRGGSTSIARWNWWRWPVVFVISASLIAVVFGQFSTLRSGREMVQNHLVAILALAVTLTVSLWFFLRHRESITVHRGFRLGAVILLALALAQSGYYIEKGLTSLRYEMRDLSRDLAQLLPERSVLAGPNAPALTIDNRIGGILEFFGPRPPQRDLFERYGVTHVAIAPSRWEWLTDHTTVNDNCPNIFNKTVRGSAVQLRRLKPVGYASTPFDSLIDAFYANDSALARQIVTKLLMLYPDNLLLQQFDVSVRYLSQDLPGTLNAVATLSERHPGNYDVQYGCAMMVARLYRVSRNPSILRMAERYLENANALDPPEVITIQRLQQIARVP